MKVTYNWLKEFVNIKLSPKELAEKLTMAGLEVVSLEELGSPVCRTGRDFVFEIEITSNRPDWLSILGVAREISAITGLRLKIIKPQELKIKAKDLQQVKVSVADKKDCPFYSAMIIRDVKVGPSPEWLKEKLESLGCRSVNNIVDITNYILFELGQPLHAFDLDKLAQQSIHVRRASPDEKIITIDGQQRILDHEILVIADNHKPVAIAGVMGGKETEVTLSTSNILLESAVFNPVLVRRSKQKLGLQSESAYRFERGVDLVIARSAALFAKGLICALASGKPSGYKSLGVAKPISAMIKLDVAYVSRILGAPISLLKVKQILNGLGFTVKTKAKGILTIKVPSFRQDINSQIDLVEEIARIYGYDKIPNTLPAVKPCENNLGKRGLISDIKFILRGLGVQETINYSLIDRNLITKSRINKDTPLVEIMNPLSKEQEVLRSTLLPSLIRALAYNLDQQQEHVNIFEIANVFSEKANFPREELALGIALCGAKSFLIKKGLIKDEVTILHLKGILEGLFSKLGIKAYDFQVQEKNQINIIIDQQEVGFILHLNEQALSDFDIKNEQVVLAEIKLEKLFVYINQEKKFTSVPKYPAITRDISFVIKNNVSIKDLLAAVEAKGAALLSLTNIVDYYQGKQIPDGFRGLTISCIYRAADRTLTEEEVSPLHNSICVLLEEQFGIKIR